MQLSVIILNYNVRFFLEQCVLSVQNALETIDGEIIVIDNSELNIANLKRSLMLLKNSEIVRPYLIDVCSHQDLKKLFYKFKPNFVFHAAAHKHVDIVEENPNFSIRNNVLGINNVLKLSREIKVTNFIFISTDKAVRPKNTMGQTKKAGEIITTFYSKFNKKNLNYNSVRFGNVIGSSGSFMQILKKQLNDGGPITITSKKATRFFMTINDAVSLVIQAPFLGESGNTFVLKMGNSINIYQMVLDITEEQAMYNFYEQMIAGDTADNVNYFKGKGKKFAEKHYANCTTKYQYTRKLYELFKEKYKSKAREKYAECYHLLKLRTE